MIDERSKRKNTFDEPNSVAVEFLDGQVWFLPKPWIQIRPVFKDGVAFSSWRAYTLGPRIDPLLELIAGVDTVDEQVVAIATVAAEMLRYHYELSDAELDSILAYRIADPASSAWFGAVVETATGRNGPKRSRAGGG
jgi:hypothetical protein